MWLSPLSKKLLFAADGEHGRDPQLVKMLRMSDCGCPAPAGTSTTQPLSLGETCGSRSGKIRRASGPGYLPRDSLCQTWQKCCPLEIPKIWLPKQDQHKGNTSWHANNLERINFLKVPPLGEELQEIPNYQEMENQHFLGKRTLINYPIPVGSPKHIVVVWNRMAPIGSYIWLLGPPVASKDWEARSWRFVTGGRALRFPKLALFLSCKIFVSRCELSATAPTTCPPFCCHVLCHNCLMLWNCKPLIKVFLYNALV